MARSRLYPGFPSEQGWQLEKGTTRKAKVWIRWIVDDQSQSIGKMVVQREAHVWRALVGYRYGKEWSYESIGEYPSATHAMSAAIAYLSKGKHNPGARWHDSKQREADQLDRAATKKWQQDFYHGKSVAHSESSLVAKSLGMNPHKRSRGRWYWGKLKAMKGSAAAFYSARKPTPRSHGSIFSSVTGPFYSRETAEDNIRYFGWALEREH